MPKPVLVIMGRWPAAGRCKQRLASEIGVFKAASIQTKLTQHTLEVAKSLSLKGLVKLQVSLTGLAPRGTERWGKHHGFSSTNNQGEGNLGVRMKRQFIKAQNRYNFKKTSGNPTIVIGTDLPGLCQRDLLLAIDSLKRKEMVIGPSTDGGYWLIGLSGGLVKPVANWPFCGIPWGTNQVLNKTLHHAEEAGSPHELLRLQTDLDRLEDLAPWKA